MRFFFHVALGQPVSNKIIFNMFPCVYSFYSFRYSSFLSFILYFRDFFFFLFLSLFVSLLYFFFLVILFFILFFDSLFFFVFALFQFFIFILIEKKKKSIMSLKDERTITMGKQSNWLLDIINTIVHIYLL